MEEPSVPDVAPGASQVRESNVAGDTGPGAARKTWVSEVPAAAKIAGVFILVAGTFFATRSSLQGDIADLRRRLPLQEHAQFGTAYEQITNLRLLERELTRLDDFVREFEVPEFVFAAAGSEAANRALYGTPNRLGPLPVPGTVAEMVVATANGAPFPEQFPIEAFTQVLFTQAMRSLPPEHSSVIVDLYSVYLAIADYNHRFLVVDPAARNVSPLYRARLTVGLPRSAADYFRAGAAQDINTIRALLPSLTGRLTAAREDIQRRVADARDA